MDNRPIGIFDSGLGGLTALKELRQLLPQEDLIYFGDTGRVPYGARSPQTLRRFAMENIRFLQSHGVKMIVAACGTISSIMTDEMTAGLEIPFTGVVKAAALAACRATRSGHIGVIGTSATIRSGSYLRIIREAMPQAQITARACPLFVPLVENGRFSPDDRIVQLVVEEYLAEIRAFGVDTLIMGCTHYPLLREAIRAYLGDDVALIDPGAEAADYVRTFLEPAELGNGRTEYYVSDDPDSFDTYAEMFLGEPAGVHASLVEDIASYGKERG